MKRFFLSLFVTVFTFLTVASPSHAQLPTNDLNQNPEALEGLITPAKSDSTGFGSGTHATSNTCTAKVGNIPAGTPPVPLGCDSTGGSNPGLGKYSFPLNPNVVEGIATEMAAYAGGYAYQGHREHAGLDIGTPNQQRVPVYAVADGTVTAARASCYANDPTCRLDISHDGDNLISSYSHIDASVRQGAKVRKGQQIGVVHFWVGYTSMDHLHFELLDKNRKSSLGVGWNINPRNYFPELMRWKPEPYGGTGQAVRAYTNSVGYTWANDGREFAENYQNHPPCPGGGGCWAH